MAKHYCRYCCSCSQIEDGFYACNVKEIILKESTIKTETNCKDYCYCDLGDCVDSEHFGKPYRPKGQYKKHDKSIKIETFNLFGNERSST